jgi:hypothetical protein
MYIHVVCMYSATLSKHLHPAAACRLHELSQLGAQSPGPGAYSTVATSPRNKAVGGWIGDAPAMVFGTGAQSSHTR